MNRIILLITLAFFSFSVFPEKISSYSYHVGQLASEWNFPSDHLPIGGRAGNVKFASWNILNPKYLHYLDSNEQGFRDCHALQSSDRHQAILNAVVGMANNLDLICLEETCEEIYSDLHEVLPKNFRILPGSHGYQDIYIYDREVFDLVHFQIRHYHIQQSSTMMTLALKEKATGITYFFVQSHVPTGLFKSRKARNEFAEYVFDNYYPGVVTILLGDMNGSPDFFLNKFNEMAKERGMKQPFANLWVHYPTHVDTSCNAVWIDNLFIANPFPELEVQVFDKGDYFFEGMQNTLDLLENKRAK